MIKHTDNIPSLFSSLCDMPNQSHPLYRLVGKTDWDKFDKAFPPLCFQDNGRPGKACTFDVWFALFQASSYLSDESVVEQWSEKCVSPVFL